VAHDPWRSVDLDTERRGARAETWVGTVPEVAYRIVATGDYNGDGKADILWHHATRGEVWLWLMDGTTKLSRRRWPRCRIRGIGSSADARPDSGFTREGPPHPSPPGGLVAQPD